ncbi:SDR family oxidoreductase [Idiomarina xiamenensis]|uniref:Uncharacterized protein n=1 Tax=Idiomarina xiamenensis 10-D-4 TaxID=740709 RepID=K2L2T6_9GAMM|nr:SDR family oxidoreductase [Idiomarina xiamenensis]EKE84195.1 hypothetical protein A10D4_05856 [Idiomarina xiamenensis 10-D-4]
MSKAALVVNIDTQLGRYIASMLAAADVDVSGVALTCQASAAQQADYARHYSVSLTDSWQREATLEQLWRQADEVNIVIAGIGDVLLGPLAALSDQAVGEHLQQQLSGVMQLYRSLLKRVSEQATPVQRVQVLHCLPDADSLGESLNSLPLMILQAMQSLCTNMKKELRLLGVNLQVLKYQLAYRDCNDHQLSFFNNLQLKAFQPAVDAYLQSAEQRWQKADKLASQAAITDTLAQLFMLDKQAR